MGMVRYLNPLGRRRIILPIPTLRLLLGRAIVLEKRKVLYCRSVPENCFRNRIKRMLVSSGLTG